MKRQMTVGGVLAATIAMIGGCTSDSGTDLCRDHHRFHADHAASAVKMDVRVSDENVISGTLLLPPHIDISQDTYDKLSSYRSIIAVDANAQCEPGATSMESVDESLVVNFTVECSPDKRIRRVDVALLDKVTALEEVVVTITTPATSKHFAINRQCAAPIFRLGTEPR